ncbi:MAG: hypothetical protein M3271_06385 [Actinomycetota bacterium]|nr:hypothetical protein [Actinomycetota bacterium]
MSSAITTPATRGSTDFGATVRGVLFSPGSGFVPALDRAETSEESRSTFLLAAAGGAAGMLLWLKLGGLVGARDVAADEFGWGLLASALFLAAIVAVLAQVAWSFLAPRAGVPDAGSPRSFRAVWALSAFPQVPVLLLLLPLDLVLVGDKAFTTERVGDSVSTAWMALSTAISLSLAVWSAYVFCKGTHVAARAPGGKTAAVVGMAVACVVLVVVILGGALVALGEAVG